MKIKTLFGIIAAFSLTVLAAACKNNAKNEENTEASEPETYLTAIDKYLGQLGDQYTTGDVCIPFHTYLSADDSNTEDILVWGDFWLFNYAVAGDTLKTVSGGAHPGLMHVKQTPEGGFEVTSFDPVLDGSEWAPSAQRIFGDRFDEFQKASSDEKLREKARLAAVADYVRKNDIAATVVQDPGWPAVKIPR